jgi:pimeloyl-ACP methyl ester carboxylesterase
MIRTPIVERSVDLGDVWLNVASAGSGRPVVLLHGFPDSWRLWRYQIRLLAAAGHRVIAPDLRGFGHSSRPSDVADYRMNVLVGDLTGLLDSTGVDRAAVVGHDWGAVLAWRLAVSLPQRVDRMVGVSVGHPAANTMVRPISRSVRGICGGSCLLGWRKGCCPGMTGVCSATGGGMARSGTPIRIATGRSMISHGRAR